MPQQIVGISVGSLNACYLAQSHSLDEFRLNLVKLKYLWLKKIKDNSSVYRSSISALNFFASNSLYNSNPLREILQNEADWNKIVASPTVLKVGAVSFHTGNLKYFSSKEESANTMLEATLASASQPILFPPVFINGEAYYDGGCKDIVPLRETLKNKADLTIAIAASPKNHSLFSDYGSCFSILGRTIDLLTSEIEENDLDVRDFKTIVEDERGGVFQLSSDKKLVIIRPVATFIDNSLDFDPNKIRMNYNHGKLIGQSIVKDWKKWIV